MLTGFCLFLLTTLTNLLWTAKIKTCDLFQLWTLKNVVSVYAVFMDFKAIQWCKGAQNMNIPLYIWLYVSSVEESSSSHTSQKPLLPRVIYTWNVSFFYYFRRHHLSRRRVIPLPKTKANPITHPQALFQKDQVSGKLKCKVTHKMCASNAMFVHITLFLIGCGREWGFTKFLICFTKKEFQQKLLRWQFWYWQWYWHNSERFEIIWDLFLPTR